MEKYKKYFKALTEFKTKDEILEEIELEFDEVLTTYMFKKITDTYFENETIQVTTFKRKKYFIAVSFLKQQGLSVDDYFDKVNLDALDNVQTKTRIEYGSLTSTAIRRINITELFT